MAEVIGGLREPAGSFADARDRVRQRRRSWARSSRTGHEPADGAGSLAGPGWSVDATVIERQRILRGWSRLELAHAAHVDPKTLRDLLGNRRRPNLGTVQATCTALGMTLAEVIRFS